MLTPSSQKSRKKISLLGLGILANAGCVPGYQSTPIPPCFFADDPDPACQSGQGHDGSGTSGGVPTTGTTFPDDDSNTEDAEGQGTGTDSSEVDPATTTSGSGSESTGPAVVPEPEILDLDLDPDAPKSAGPVMVTVQAANAVEVWMTVDEGGEVALEPVGDEGTEFVGEIAVLGESWNGDHTVSAVARTGELESLPWEAMFSVTAPPAGSEAWLEKSLLNPSYGNAVAVDAQGDVYELFTHSSNQGERCYLRRRDQTGVIVWQDDARQVGGEACLGEDIKVGPDGSLWVLMNTSPENAVRWELWHLNNEAMLLENPKIGSVTHIGKGLDVNADGDVLLCGTWPGLLDDDDTWIRLLPAVGEGWTRSWDYVPPALPPNKVIERATDCAFVSDRIVVVGEAFGKLAKDDFDSKARGFVLELERNSVKASEAIMTAEMGWQSGFRAVAPDGSGGYAAVGHTCNQVVVPCTPTQGLVGWFSLGGQASGTAPVSKTRWISDVALGPNEQVVIAAQASNDTNGVLVQAWEPGTGMPLWSYQGAPSALQAAYGIAVGPYAFVYGVGFYLEANNTLASGVVKVHPL
jgi:hypothetical protein